MLNYAFVQTVPSWVNVKRPDVSIQESIWTSTSVALVSYLCIGIFPALAYVIPSNVNFLTVLSTMNVASRVFGNLFSMMVLMTSIPVFLVISQLNLIQNFEINNCKNLYS
jgi:hypothetical protein